MKILKLDPKQRLSLEEILKHPFITKFIPDIIKYLIKPEEDTKYNKRICLNFDPSKERKEEIKRI